MKGGIFIVFIILVLTGVIHIMVGIRIRVKKQLTLIAGVNNDNRQSVKDPEGLSKLVGNATILMGLVTALLPVSIYFAGHLISWSVFAVFVAAHTVRVIVGARKYT